MIARSSNFVESLASRMRESPVDEESSRRVERFRLSAIPLRNTRDLNSSEREAGEKEREGLDKLEQLPAAVPREEKFLFINFTSFVRNERSGSAKQPRRKCRASRASALNINKCDRGERTETKRRGCYFIYI